MRVWLVLIFAACGSDPVVGHDTTSSAADTTNDTTAPVERWSISVVESGTTEGVGRGIQATVLGDGSPVVAAYHDSGVAGDLCVAGSDAGGQQVAWTLRYATPSGPRTATTWQVEDVAAIVHLGPPRGFDLATDGDGAARIAALTGAVSELPPYCGANDLGLYRRDASGWVADVVVADSNEAMTGEPASDFGNVVGLWPALAYDGDGAAIVAYKDVHGGGLQGDDFTRADFEVALQDGSGWRHEAVDIGKGAGDYGAAAFTDDGRPVLVQFNPRDDLAGSERGIWALRSDDGGDTWDRVHLLKAGTGERPSLAVAADGTTYVAWYDGALGLPYVARLDDPERFSELDAWVIEDIGDRVFDEGRHPSIAISDEGVVGVAYQRCGRASDGIGDCNPARDAVVFAWLDGDIWEREIIEEEPDGLCGNFTTLVFAGDSATVFYQCQVAVDGGFGTELRAARRQAL